MLVIPMFKPTEVGVKDLTVESSIVEGLICVKENDLTRFFDSKEQMIEYYLYRGYTSDFDEAVNAWRDRMTVKDWRYTKCLMKSLG